MVTARPALTPGRTSERGIPKMVDGALNLVGDAADTVSASLGGAEQVGTRLRRCDRRHAGGGRPPGDAERRHGD